MFFSSFNGNCGDLERRSPASLIPQSRPTTACASCSTIIHDRYYLEVADRCWHIDCLQCCMCKLKLVSAGSCFTRDGQIFCRDDYYRQFAKRCARCDRVLTSSELVMKAKELTYHLQCFSCVVCNSALNPGEHFGLASNGYVYCQVHYEPLLYAPSVQPKLEPGGMYLSSGFVEATQALPTKGRPKKRKAQRNVSAPSSTIHHTATTSLPLDSCLISQPGVDTQLAPLLGNGSNSVSKGRSSPTSPLSSNGGGHKSGRNKRMRTSFKHHQLRAMKAYFAVNHNPDAKDLKQLAQKTGLTKRVLQVWFQNARAKFRRSQQLKQGGAYSCDDLPEGAAILPTATTPGGQPGGPSDDGKESIGSIVGSMSASSSSCCGDDTSLQHADLGSDSETTLGGGRPQLPISAGLTLDITTYSPQFVALGDVESTSSKSLADYFQTCDPHLL